MNARLLHLIDPGECAWPAMAMLRAIRAASSSGVQHETLVIGGSDAAARAGAFGLESSSRIAPILGRPMLAAPALKRYLASRGGADVMVAWSMASAVMAHQRAGRTPVVTVLSVPPPPFEGAARWTIAARAIRRSALIVYPSAFLRDSWVARFTLLGCPGTVIAASPARRATHEADRAALRREWGVDAGTLVITPLGEPASAIDAHAAVFAAGVLGVAGRAAVVVVPPDASRLDRALRFASRIRPHRRVIVDDRPVFEMLPGCDLALWYEPEGEVTRPGGSAYTTALGAVSLAWAEVSGVPIVAHDHPSWRSVVRDSTRCIAVGGRTRHALTRAILGALRLPRAEATGPAGEHAFAFSFESRVMELLRERARGTALVG
jgi:hypothetical protein